MNMKTFRVMGPSGPMETVATSPEKARANFRWRLSRDCRLSRFAAKNYDLSDMREVSR